MAVFKTTLWRLISGTLGIICLSLMSTLGILLKNSFTKLSIEPAFTPGPNIELQKDSDCCSCQEKWVGYRCNCYFISSEQKTWNESRHLCASQKSSLLQLQNTDELQDFMSSSQQFYWIGLSYSEEHTAWLWENGSALSQYLFPSFETFNTKNCIAYNPNGNALDESCEDKNRYIYYLIWGKPVIMS
ncbi:natural killer cells antigen CD94 isoform X6 [Homo sapiens]|uniref:natural killer cells antigen CD94 isoform X6 n=1 Tax=Homo sapiens TaxID=9606 RepID=UPI0005D0359D|nr:natural killer cells antigen CD94 isoform X6 [Homo sapiens]|eukprot:XP_011518953.1 natural killer cells antigen CD94 isoform X5 [Homo sapiens]